MQTGHDECRCEIYPRIDRKRRWTHPLLNQFRFPGADRVKLFRFVDFSSMSSRQHVWWLRVVLLKNSAIKKLLYWWYMYAELLYVLLKTQLTALLLYCTPVSFPLAPCTVPCSIRPPRARGWGQTPHPGRALAYSVVALLKVLQT